MVRTATITINLKDGDRTVDSESVSILIREEGEGEIVTAPGAERVPTLSEITLDPEPPYQLNQEFTMSVTVSGANGFWRTQYGDPAYLMYVSEEPRDWVKSDVATISATYKVIRRPSGGFRPLIKIGVQEFKDNKRGPMFLKQRTIEIVDPDYLPLRVQFVSALFNNDTTVVERIISLLRGEQGKDSSEKLVVHTDLLTPIMVQWPVKRPPDLLTPEGKLKVGKTFYLLKQTSAFAMLNTWFGQTIAQQLIDLMVPPIDPDMSDDEKDKLFMQAYSELWQNLDFALALNEWSRLIFNQSQIEGVPDEPDELTPVWVAMALLPFGTGKVVKGTVEYGQNLAKKLLAIMSPEKAFAVIRSLSDTRLIKKIGKICDSANIDKKPKEIDCDLIFAQAKQDIQKLLRSTAALRASIDNLIEQALNPGKYMVPGRGWLRMYIRDLYILSRVIEERQKGVKDGMDTLQRDILKNIFAKYEPETAAKILRFWHNRLIYASSSSRAIMTKAQRDKMFKIFEKAFQGDWKTPAALSENLPKTMERYPSYKPIELPPSLTQLPFPTERVGKWFRPTSLAASLRREAAARNLAFQREEELEAFMAYRGYTMMTGLPEYTGTATDRYFELLRKGYFSPFGVRHLFENFPSRVPSGTTSITGSEWTPSMRLEEFGVAQKVSELRSKIWTIAAESKDSTKDIAEWYAKMLGDIDPRALISRDPYLIARATARGPWKDPGKPLKFLETYHKQWAEVFVKSPISREALRAINRYFEKINVEKAKGPQINKEDLVTKAGNSRVIGELNKGWKAVEAALVTQGLKMMGVKKKVPDLPTRNKARIIGGLSILKGSVLPFVILLVAADGLFWIPGMLLGYWPQQRVDNARAMQRDIMNVVSLIRSFAIDLSSEDVSDKQKQAMYLALSQMIDLLIGTEEEVILNDDGTVKREEIRIPDDDQLPSGGLTSNLGKHSWLWSGEIPAWDFDKPVFHKVEIPGVTLMKPMVGGLIGRYFDFLIANADDMYVMLRIGDDKEINENIPYEAGSYPFPLVGGGWGNVPKLLGLLNMFWDSMTAILTYLVTLRKTIIESSVSRTPMIIENPELVDVRDADTIVIKFRRPNVPRNLKVGGIVETLEKFEEISLETEEDYQAYLDTLWPDGSEHVIRIGGIDAAEYSDLAIDPYGQKLEHPGTVRGREAKEIVEKILTENEFTIYVDWEHGTDVYGRTLGTIYYGENGGRNLKGKNLSVELLKMCDSKGNPLVDPFLIGRNKFIDPLEYKLAAKQCKARQKMAGKLKITSTPDKAEIYMWPVPVDTRKEAETIARKGDNIKWAGVKWSECSLELLTPETVTLPTLGKSVWYAFKLKKTIAGVTKSASFVVKAEDGKKKEKHINIPMF